jgi:hypothetical protein
MTMMLKSVLKVFGICLVLAATACGWSYGQVDESTATVRGTVYDPQGATVAGAIVTATNPATGVTRSTVSSHNGTYQIQQLSPATYEMQAKANGFASEKATEVVLTVGLSVVLDAHLTVGSVNEVVVVNGNVTPLIDIEQTQQANTLNENVIQGLPNIGRNFLNEVLTLPGVGSTAGAAAQFTGFYYGSTGLAIGGSNGRGNLITVNSGEDDYGTGAVRYFPPLDSVQEEQVNRSGYQPEFGFSSGAAINVVTKSGTNAFHGDAFGYLTDRYTIAETYLTKLTDPEASKPYYQSYFAGASLGGPIVKDKLFFFAAYEFNHVDSAVIINNATSPYLQPFNGSQGDTSCLTTPTTSPSQYCLLQAIAQDGGAYDPQDAMLAQQFLNSPNVSPTNPNVPNPFYPNNDKNLQKLVGTDEGVFDNPTRTNNLTSRFDYQFSNKNTITGTFSFEYGSTYDGGVTPDSIYNPTRDYEATVDWVHIFSPNAYNKVLVQHAYNRFDQDTINSPGPEISIQYLGGPLGPFGHASTSTYLARQHREEFSDDFSLTKGTHNMKAGISYRPAQYSINNPNYAQGEFDFDGGFPLTSIGGLGFPGFSGQAYGVPNTYAALPYLLGALGFCPPAAAGASPNCIPASADLSATQLFSDAVPYSFEGSSGSGLVNFNANYGAFYAQDLWKVTPHFTLTYGGRLDIDAEPSPLRTYKVFSPRAGLAWTPYGNAKTLIRAGGGVFATPTNFLEPFYTNLYGPLTGKNPYLTTTAVDVLEPNNTLGFYGPILSLYQTNLGPNGLPFHSPTPAQETAAGLQPGVFGRLVQFINSKFTNQKVYQASVSVEQQLGKDYALEVGYLFYRGVHLPDPVLVGYQPSAACQLSSTGTTAINPVVGPQYCEVAPYTTTVNGGEAFSFTSNGTSVYHGATVSVTKRLSHHVQFQGSYTWSRAIDDATDFNNAFASFRPNGLSVAQERGVSDFNRTNVFVASGVYNTQKLIGGRSWVRHLFSDMTVGPVLTLSSGSPFDIDISSPFSNGAPLPNNVSRPYNAQRNSGQGPGFDSTDLRFTKAIPLNRADTSGLSFQINVTNLFNAADFDHVNNFFPSSVAGSGIGSTAPLSTYVYTAAGNQSINFATGPFNVHGVRPSSLTQLQTNGGPLYFSAQSPPRSAQVGLSYYF